MPSVLSEQSRSSSDTRKASTGARISGAAVSFASSGRINASLRSKQSMSSTSSSTPSSPSLTSRIKHKSSSSFFSFFTLKDPAAVALEQVAHNLREHPSAVEFLTTANISCGQRLPASVPKVNSKWNGLPPAAGSLNKTDSIRRPSESSSGTLPPRSSTSRSSGQRTVNVKRSDEWPSSCRPSLSSAWTHDNSISIRRPSDVEQPLTSPELPTFSRWDSGKEEIISPRRAMTDQQLLPEGKSGTADMTTSTSVLARRRPDTKASRIRKLALKVDASDTRAARATGKAQPVAARISDGQSQSQSEHTTASNSSPSTSSDDSTAASDECGVQVSAFNSDTPIAAALEPEHKPRQDSSVGMQPATSTTKEVFECMLDREPEDKEPSYTVRTTRRNFSKPFAGLLKDRSIRRSQAGPPESLANDLVSVALDTLALRPADEAAQVCSASDTPRATTARLCVLSTRTAEETQIALHPRLDGPFDVEPPYNLAPKLPSLVK